MLEKQKRYKELKLKLLKSMSLSRHERNKERKQEQIKYKAKEVLNKLQVKIEKENDIIEVRQIRKQRKNNRKLILVEVRTMSKKNENLKERNKLRGTQICNNQAFQRKYRINKDN